MDDDCSRCSRRTALGGLGSLGALAVLGAVPGCAAKHSLTVGAATPCTGGLCIDLTAAANAPLESVGGGLLIRGSTDSIAVVRTSATTLAAVSAVCTHEGCVNEYDAGSQTFDCPCHGSSFATSGAVLRGPASRSLHAYVVTLSGDTVTLVAS